MAMNKDIILTIVHNGKNYENVQYKDLAGCCFSLDKFLSVKDLLSENRIIDIIDDFREKDFDNFIRFITGQGNLIDDVTNDFIEILKIWGCHLVIKYFQEKLDKKNINKVERVIDKEKAAILKIDHFPLNWNFSSFSYIVKNGIMKNEEFWEAFCEMYAKQGKIVVSYLDFIDIPCFNELKKLDPKNLCRYPMVVEYIYSLQNRNKIVEEEKVTLEKWKQELTDGIKDLKRKCEEYEFIIKEKDRFHAELSKENETLKKSIELLLEKSIECEKKDNEISILSNLCKENETKHKQEIRIIKEGHEQEISAIKEGHKQEISTIKEGHKQEIKKNEKNAKGIVTNFLQNVELKFASIMSSQETFHSIFFSFITSFQEKYVKLKEMISLIPIHKKLCLDQESIMKNNQEEISKQQETASKYRNSIHNAILLLREILKLYSTPVESNSSDSTPPETKEKEDHETLNELIIRIRDILVEKEKNLQQQKAEIDKQKAEIQVSKDHIIKMTLYLQSMKLNPMRKPK